MRWTPEMDAQLTALYATHTRPQIEQLMALTNGQVRSRLSTLGLAEKIRQWTESEIESLCSAYKNATVNELLDLDRLAALFGRHKSNVCRKARALGLTNQKRPDVVEPKGKAPPQFATAEARSAAMSARVIEQWRVKGHPRGALGMVHSAATRALLSAASKRSHADPDSGLNSAANRQRLSDLMVARVASGDMRGGGHTRCRGGKRADIGDRYFRSAWEANYARYLTWLQQRGEIIGWDYECKTFVFEAIKRGTRAYTPDFKVTSNDGSYAWHEVKGWMDAASKTRLARMARYFPAEKVIVVDAAWFRSANKTLPGLIPHWERGTTR